MNKAQCPDCGRLISTINGGMYPHGDGVGKVRCPGTGKAPISPDSVPATMGFRVGDRVARLPDGPYGIVTQLDSDGRVFCHWGTASYPDNSAPGGQSQRRFEDWVPPEELKLLEDVVWEGDPETGKRKKVWDPKERGRAESFD